jgi:ligand-binding SRPBCC domain-containing protein
MTKVETSVMIEASLEKVYAFASDWRNFLRYFTYIRDVRPLTEKTLGEGAELGLKVKFRGLPLNALWRGVGEANTQGWAFDAKLMGRWARKTWRLSPVDNGTRLTFVLEYSMPPIPLLANLMDRLWMRPGWERIYAESFANLKQVMETESGAVTPDASEPSPA